MTIIPTRTSHRSRALACLAALLLAACGGGSGGSSPTNGDAGSPDAGNDPDAPPVMGSNVPPGAPDSGDGGELGETLAPDFDGADLTHAGVRLPRNAIDPLVTANVSDAGRARVAALAEPLGVIYEVTENHGEQSGESCRELGAEYASCSVVNLHIKDSGGALDGDGWRLYFHSLRRVLRIDSDAFEAYHVNGDLHYLAPASGFAGIDGVATVKLFVEFSQLRESDFLPRYWLVRDGGTPELLPNTDTETNERAYAMPITGDNRNGFNGEPTPQANVANRHADNADRSARAAALDARTVQARIVPAPRSMVLGAQNLDIGGGFSFAGTELSAASVAALETRQRQFAPVGTAVALSASIDTSLAAGSHTLAVTPGGIALRGADEEALFHAAQSLLSLVQPGVGTIPTVQVEDGPRFAHRGMHVDVARNFQSAASLRRLLDQMAAYKLNRLHLHLSDDEGWRLEIPALPELTRIGARRAFALDANGAVDERAGLMPQLGSGPFDDNAGTGHLSRAEFVELLRYAAARHVEVIPEFDMPAHARAAVIAMRVRAANLGRPDDTSIRIDDPDDSSRYVTVQHYDDGILNPCVPGTYAFVETVVGEVAAMYAEAGAPLNVWHMGGDEARNIYRGGGYPDADTNLWDLPWENSPACAATIAATPGLDSREDLERHLVERVAAIVADAGIPRLYAWHEIIEGIDPGALATDGVGVTFWRSVWSGESTTNAANDFAARGVETVLSVPDFLYFDFPQEVDPAERGQYWATRMIDVAKLFSFAPENLPQNAETSVDRVGRVWSGSGADEYPGYTGMQGQLWSELVRTPEQLDYMIFPRLLALAERAWHRAGWEQDYAPGRTYDATSGRLDREALADDLALFTAALGQKELAKLDAAGVAYRIPVPGAASVGGALDLNVALPGLPLEYSTDGSSFVASQDGSAPASAVAVRARSADGSRAGRADTVD